MGHPLVVFFWFCCIVLRFFYSLICLLLLSSPLYHDAELGAGVVKKKIRGRPLLVVLGHSKAGAGYT